MSYLIIVWSHSEPSGNQSLTVTIWTEVYKGTNTSEFSLLTSCPSFLKGKLINSLKSFTRFCNGYILLTVID